MLRRLLRILFGLTTIVSLLLFVCSVTVWIRSHSAREELTIWGDVKQAGHDGLSITWFTGELIVERMQFQFAPHDYQWYIATNHGRETAHIRWESMPFSINPQSRQDSLHWAKFHGFSYKVAHRNQRVGGTQTYLCAPLWFVTLGTLVIPATVLGMVWRKRRRRLQRIRLGLCLQCGYDLRATPHRCPECGSPSAMRAN